VQTSLVNNIRYFFIQLFCLLVFCLIAQQPKAQIKHWDTIKHYVSTAKPTFALELDGRQSFFREIPVTIDGIRIGADFGNRVRFFIGGYWNSNTVSRTLTINRYTPAERKIKQDLSMFYISATVEYVFYTTKHWELAVPVQLGFGSGKRTRYDATTNNKIEQIRAGFVPLEFGFKAMYKITDWLNISVGLGYRYALFSSTVSDDFSAAYYTYGIGISPIKILKKVGLLEEKDGKLRLKQ